MSSFKDALLGTDSAFFNEFGDSVFINGIEYTVIIDDETFIDESMQQRQKTITLKRDDVQFFNTGNGFILDNKKYRLGAIILNDYNDTMQTFELIDAN